MGLDVGDVVILVLAEVERIWGLEGVSELAPCFDFPRSLVSVVGRIDWTVEPEDAFDTWSSPKLV